MIVLRLGDDAVDQVANRQHVVDEALDLAGPPHAVLDVTRLEDALTTTPPGGELGHVAELRTGL